MTLPIAILRIKNGGNVVLRVDDGTYTKDVIDPADAIVSLTVANNGTLTVAADGGTSYAWITGGAPAAYEVRVTATSGSMSSGTMATWLALSTTRSWTVERTVIGTKTCIATVEIGLLGTATMLETGTITMSSSVEP